jgi:SAM-dependent methyltransferase
VGAAHGTFTALFATGAHVVASEPSLASIDVLQNRFADNPNVEVRKADLAEAVSGQHYDSIVLINVLEHIDDDGSSLRLLSGALRPGGRLVLWVPAFTQLYSEFDRSVGHYRRYRLRDLNAMVAEAGLSVVDARYVNAVGAVAWWAVANQLGQRPTTPRRVKIYDRAGVPVLRSLEAHRRPPFGQSIFCVAAKPSR